MKITKSMFINPTTESRELFMCVIHNGDINNLKNCIFANLAKKYAKGIYDHDLAVAAWYNAATEQSKVYNRDFGYMFTVNERYNAAIELESHYYDYMLNNEESV